MLCMPVPADFVRQQIAVVLDDIGADAVKTGMLADADIIVAIARNSGHVRAACRWSWTR